MMWVKPGREQGDRPEAMGSAALTHPTLAFIFLLVMLASNCAAKADMLNSSPYAGAQSRKNFFGDVPGDLLPYKKMADEFNYALCIDFYDEGRTITRMPEVGPGEYLDVGKPCDNTFNVAVAVIVDKDAQILAAALYSEDCKSNGPLNPSCKPYVKIFLKNAQHRSRYIVVFENWALASDSELMDNRQTDSANGYKEWKSLPAHFGLERQVVVLGNSQPF